MGKRSLEREIDSLTADTLETLKPLERLRIALLAQARGHPEWLDQLVESQPPGQSKQVFRYGLAALELSHHVAYDLQTLTLEFEREHGQWAFNVSHIDNPSDEVVTLAAKRRTAATQTFAVLDAQTRAAERFAEEVLGLDLETWLALHPDRERLVKTVKRTLDNEAERAAANRRLVEGTLFEAEEDTEDGDEEAANGEDKEITLEGLADSMYERLVAMWDSLTDVGEADRASATGR